MFQSGELEIHSSYLVRHSQGELDLVGDSVGIGSAAGRDANGGRTHPEGSPCKSKRAHCVWDVNDGED